MPSTKAQQETSSSRGKTQHTLEIFHQALKDLKKDLKKTLRQSKATSANTQASEKSPVSSSPPLKSPHFKVPKSASKSPLRPSRSPSSPSKSSSKSPMRMLPKDKTLTKLSSTEPLPSLHEDRVLSARHYHKTRKLLRNQSKEDPGAGYRRSKTISTADGKWIRRKSEQQEHSSNTSENTPCAPRDIWEAAEEGTGALVRWRSDDLSSAVDGVITVGYGTDTYYVNEAGCTWSAPQSPAESFSAVRGKDEVLEQLGDLALHSPHAERSRPSPPSPFSRCGRNLPSRWEASPELHGEVAKLEGGGRQEGRRFVLPKAATLPPRRTEGFTSAWEIRDHGSESQGSSPLMSRMGRKKEGPTLVTLKPLRVRLNVGHD